MDEFKLNTSFQFPFFKLNEIVYYSEVTKPSGIAYMILVLINEAKNKDVLLSQLLETFGVSSELQTIFSEEIRKLSSQKIIKIGTRDTFYGEDNYYYFLPLYDESDFDNLKIGSLFFTEKGKKIFAEESIPTGAIKEEKVPIYFNIAMEELYFEIPRALEPRPLMDSALSEEFFSRFSCSKNIEDFVNKNKGIKVEIKENGKNTKTFFIKKEEIITNVEDISQENWTGKYDCTLKIQNNSLSFAFNEKKVQMFFDNNFTSDIINNAINKKNKFQFKSAYKENLELSNYEDKKIVDLILPSELDNILKQKGQMLITRGNYTSDKYYIVESIEALQKYDLACEFITVDYANNIYAFIPGIFKFENKEHGIIDLPLVLKIRLSLEQLKDVLNIYVNNLNVYS